MLNYLSKNKTHLLINIIILLVGYALIIYSDCFSGSDLKRSNIYTAIGTSLIATALVLVLDLWRKFTIKELNKQIQNVINSAGIARVSKSRSLERYDDLMKKLKTSLDICGYSLGSFFENYSDLLNEKTTNKNIKVRVLFVNPDCEAAKIRADIESKNIKLFKEKLKTFSNHFKDNTNVEIKLIDVPLSSMIFRIDKVMFVGPHFYKRQSSATLTKELSHGKWLFTAYQSEFDRMWEDASNFN